MALSPTSSRGGFSGGTVPNASTFSSEVTFAGNDGEDFAAYVASGTSQAGGIGVTAPTGATGGYKALYVENHAGDTLLRVSATGYFEVGLAAASARFSVYDQNLNNLIDGNNNNLTIGSTTGSTGFFGGSGTPRPSVTGALSTVIDPAAKAVLTSLLAALVGFSLVSDGTT